MSRVGFALMLLGLLLGSMACGGGKSSSTQPSSTGNTVSISPTTASVATSTTQQFTANVVNPTNTAVTWQVNGNLGGNFTVGTISSSGLYTAPGVVPNPATVTVTAISQADVTQSASAKVTITAGTAISITVSPTSATVSTGRTEQFTANVTPAANTVVSWQVNGVNGGDSTHGTISATGLYTAPAAVPSPSTVTITAISQADSTKSATAQVTIVPAVNLTISPLSAQVPAGGQQAFTATINGQNASVTWSVSCHSASASVCGSISSTGVYTAPLSPPPGTDVVVTATTTDGSAPPAGAVVTVVFSNGTLNGQYAFSFAGRNAAGTFVEAGSVAFDGNGNIAGGISDTNNSGFSSANITGGTYEVGTDGRGSATVQTQSGPETWQFAAVNHTRVLAMRAEAGVTASGSLDLQDSSQFNQSAIVGKYSLGLAGVDTGGIASSLAMAGALSADGAGGLSQGLLDVNNGGSAQNNMALTGNYAPASNSGRGTMTLSSSFGNQALVYYVVDGSHLKLLETDSTKLRGELVKQPAEPFANANFRASFAFTFAGSSSQGALGAGGLLSLDGAGNISGGTMDINNAGLVQTGPITGTYGVTDATTGRATANLTVNGAALQFVFYPQIGGLNFLEMDAANVATGRAFQQSGSAFANSSLQGSYAMRLAGVDLTAGPGELDITGQLLPNGGSALTGTLDISDNGGAANGNAIQGSYSVTSAAGRGTAAMQTPASAFGNASLRFYCVTTDFVLWLDTDATRVLTGEMQKQF